MPDVPAWKLMPLQRNRARAGEQIMSTVVHYLSRRALQAPRLSPSEVKSKIDAGWVWHQLVPAFCTAGGAGSYGRALISPAGEIAYVSDRAAGPPASTLPQLLMDHTLIKLEVPYADKDQAKARGAVWVGHLRLWACAPARIEDFRRWIDGDPHSFDLMIDTEPVRSHDRPRA